MHQDENPDVKPKRERVADKLPRLILDIRTAVTDEALGVFLGRLLDLYQADPKSVRRLMAVMAGRR